MMRRDDIAKQNTICKQLFFFNDTDFTMVWYSDTRIASLNRFPSALILIYDYDLKSLYPSRLGTNNSIKVFIHFSLLRHVGHYLLEVSEH